MDIKFITEHSDNITNNGFKILFNILSFTRNIRTIYIPKLYWLFNKLCLSERFDVYEWIIATYFPGCDHHYYNSDLLYIVCSNNEKYLNVLNWILQKDREVMKLDYRKCIVIACKKKCLWVIRKLIRQNIYYDRIKRIDAIHCIWSMSKIYRSVGTINFQDGKMYKRGYKLYYYLVHYLYYELPGPFMYNYYIKNICQLIKNIDTIISDDCFLWDLFTSAVMARLDPGAKMIKFIKFYLKHCHHRRHINMFVRIYFLYGGLKKKLPIWLLYNYPTLYNNYTILYKRIMKIGGKDRKIYKLCRENCGVIRRICENNAKISTYYNEDRELRWKAAVVGLPLLFSPQIYINHRRLI